MAKRAHVGLPVGQTRLAASFLERLSGSGVDLDRVARAIGVAGATAPMSPDEKRAFLDGIAARIDDPEFGLGGRSRPVTAPACSLVAWKLSSDAPLRAEPGLGSKAGARGPASAGW